MFYAKLLSSIASLIINIQVLIRCHIVTLQWKPNLDICLNVANVFVACILWEFQALCSNLALGLGSDDQFNKNSNTAYVCLSIG